MTVADLIARLQTFPPDLLVLVDEYEAGQDTPGWVVPVKAWEVKTTVYTGPFRVCHPAQKPEDTDERCDEEHPETRPAVLISCRGSGDSR
jgi:hypothetical protein